MSDMTKHFICGIGVGIMLGFFLCVLFEVATLQPIILNVKGQVVCGQQ
jgi:F0F1-type ATP synthase assembly protein I